MGLWQGDTGTSQSPGDQGEVIMGQVDEVVGHGEMTMGHGDTATDVVWGQDDRTGGHS